MTAEVVIPAFNEAPTVGDVVAVAKGSPLVSRVVVVDDGSTDRTAEAARAAGADAVIGDGINRGKGAAVRLGVAATSAPVVLLLDADMLGFTTGHLREVLSPVTSGGAAMSAGIPGRGAVYDWLALRLPKITGERAVKREVFDLVDWDAAAGFGLELALNDAARRLGGGTAAMTLHGARLRKKHEKVGWRRAVPQYLVMFKQMTRAWWLIRRR
jgi:glycosyltransferase involved in cell wall biosynthesis